MKVLDSMMNFKVGKHNIKGFGVVPLFEQQSVPFENNVLIKKTNNKSPYI